MKKILIIIIFIITFWLLYFLQANFFNWFTIAGISPNLFIIFVLFISLYAGSKVGILLGVILGLLLDILLGKNLGISAVMYGIVGMIGGYFDKNFSKESRITMMLMVMGSTCIFEIGAYVFQMMQLSVEIEFIPFLRILFIEVVYNTILTIILYPFMQKRGYRIEDTFKGQKVLTRYF